MQYWDQFFKMIVLAGRGRGDYRTNYRRYHIHNTTLVTVLR